MEIDIKKLCKDETFKQQFSDFINEIIVGDMEESFMEIWNECNRDVSDFVDVVVYIMKDTATSKEGLDMANILAHKMSEDDPSIRLDFKLTWMELMMDEDFAELLALNVLHKLDDTICIEDYL